MQYLTYEEYKALGGELTETAFNKYGYQAEMRIKAETHNRIAEPGEAVKRCMARLIDILSKADTTNAGDVSSFSHDGLTQSFAVKNSEEYTKEANEIIYTYLIHEVDKKGIPLLYRGADIH